MRGLDAGEEEEGGAGEYGSVHGGVWKMAVVRSWKHAFVEPASSDVTMQRCVAQRCIILLRRGVNRSSDVLRSVII